MFNLQSQNMYVISFSLPCSTFVNILCLGVRAQLIDKDKSPKWQPDDITDVVDDTIIKAFEPLPKDQELDI